MFCFNMCVYVCMYLSMHVCVCMLCMLCMHVCMHVCICVYVHCAHTTLHENRRVDFGLDEATAFKYLRGVCRHSNDLDRFCPVIRRCGFARVGRASNRTPAREYSRARTPILKSNSTTTRGPFPDDMCGHEGFCRPPEIIRSPGDACQTGPHDIRSLSIRPPGDPDSAPSACTPKLGGRC